MGGAPFAGLLALAKLSKAPLQLLALYVLSGKTIAHIAQDLKHFVQKAYEFLGRRWRGWFGPAAWLPTLRVSLACSLFAVWVGRRVLARRRLAGRAGEMEAKLLELITQMEEAESYEEWREAATRKTELESSEQGTEEDRVQREAKLYDRDLLLGRYKHLRRQRERGDAGEMMFALRADLLRNLGNMTDRSLHEMAIVRVPQAIQEYTDEVKLQLQYLTNYDLPDLPDEEKLAFLQETRHAFGRTALVLSGGGTLGGFHLGVVKVLLEQRCLPRILAGSDVGAIVCAVVGTRTSEQLEELFKKQVHELHSTFFGFGNSEMLRGFLHGAHYKPRVLQAKLRALLGDLTFQEAFDLSGRIVNISVAKGRKGEPPRLLNYLSAPHGVLWSAVAASSALPGVSPELLARSRTGELVPYEADGVRRRKWRAGPMEATLTRGMGVLFNVNHFLLSQANPHVAPFLRFKREIIQMLSLSRLAAIVEMEWRHRISQLQQILPLTTWMRFLGQQWEGDVTMVMPTSWTRWMYFFSSPTQQDMNDMVRLGERITWEKVSAIQVACGIEITLDECVQAINEKIRLLKQGGGGQNLVRGASRGRIPSWNAFPSTFSRESSLGSIGSGPLACPDSPTG